MSDFERRVRPYTSEERREIEWHVDEAKAEKIVRLARTQEIDFDRYDQAAAEHPELAEHMARLKTIGVQATEAWTRYCELESNDGVLQPAPSQEEIRIDSSWEAWHGVEPITVDEQTEAIRRAKEAASQTAIA